MFGMSSFEKRRNPNITGKEGKTTKEIAKKLGSAISTVETHRKAIAKKLKVSGSEMIRRAALNHAIQSIN